MKRLVACTAGFLLLTGLVAGCGSKPGTDQASGGNKAPAYPTKPITALVGYEAGATTDVIARAVFKEVEKELGQPIMVVNKPGAASVQAMIELKSAQPDGYTLGVSASINSLKVQGKLPFDHHDLDMIAVPAQGVSVVAVPANSPFKSAKDLVEYAKANPGKVTLSTTAKGAVNWIQAKLFEKAAGVQFQFIENPGGNNLIAQQLAGGHVHAGFALIPGLKGQFDAGNIRFIGIMADQRVPGYENVPTLKELGYNALHTATIHVVAPKGLPKHVLDKLTSAFQKAAATEEFKQWVKDKAFIATPHLVGAEAVKFLDEDLQIQLPLLESIGALKK